MIPHWGKLRCAGHTDVLGMKFKGDPLEDTYSTKARGSWGTWRSRGSRVSRCTRFAISTPGARSTLEKAREKGRYLAGAKKTAPNITDSRKQKTQSLHY